MLVQVIGGGSLVAKLGTIAFIGTITNLSCEESSNLKHNFNIVHIIL